MKLVVALAAAALGGCGASLGDPGASGDDTGSAHGPGTDAGARAGDAALPLDAAPACANHRKLFLDFDGVTLTQGASDATMNRASWIGDSDPAVTSGTVPPYHQGSATRAADIQAIVTAVQGYLAADPIDVVTTRPAAGPYVMVALGGSMDALGIPYSIAVNDLDCGDLLKSDVAWVSDATPLAKVPSYVIGAVGYGLGLTATEDPGDCMCGWDNDCQQSDAACTLSASIAADDRCSAATQDEVAAFATEFCAN